jgi:transcription antitermination factor NusG
MSENIACQDNSGYAIGVFEPNLSAELDISAPCMSGLGQQTSSKISTWGGARPNSGGARPNCGGPQPGSGRPRKVAIPAPIATLDIPRWAVFSVFGPSEMSVTADLTRQGYETYLPMVAIRKPDPVLKTMFHTVRVPLLSGYGFIRLAQSESREPITATRGVREVLRRPDGRNAIVRDAEIALLRSHDEERLKLPAVSAPVIPPGTHVALTDGPFASFSGVVLQCDGYKTRVEVQMFGSMMPIWFNRASVETTTP